MSNMSDRLKTTENVSNEEVIEDLTKDLTSLGTQENFDDFVINPAHSSEGISPVHQPPRPTDDLSSNQAYDDEFDRKESPKDDSDDDSIDEESLKDAEVDLTDDQKEERKLIAEQLKVTGNNAFKDGEFERSIEKYTEALQICPLSSPSQRAILYCNRSAAKMKIQKYKKATKDCTKALELDSQYLKAYIRRAQCYEALEKYEESLADYQKILELDPKNQEALKASVRLPPLIEQKNEQLKTEMLGKLKDLGNMILKPFGLSTDNFQLEQDAESKGYKINFKQ